MKIEISSTELATILAALRFYQEQGMGDPFNRSNDIHEIAHDGGEVISLDDEGIDELCERLNTTGERDENLCRDRIPRDA